MTNIMSENVILAEIKAKSDLASIELKGLVDIRLARAALYSSLVDKITEINEDTPALIQRILTSMPM